MDNNAVSGLENSFEVAVRVPQVPKEEGYLHCNKQSNGTVCGNNLHLIFNRNSKPLYKLRSSNPKLKTLIDYVESMWIEGGEWN